MFVFHISSLNYNIGKPSKSPYQLMDFKVNPMFYRISRKTIGLKVFPDVQLFKHIDPQPIFQCTKKNWINIENQGLYYLINT